MVKLLPQEADKDLRLGSRLCFWVDYWKHQLQIFYHCGLQSHKTKHEKAGTVASEDLTQ